MLKITHEFPLCYYLDGTAERLTDFDYCLVHRYLDHPEYAKYMKDAVNKGRELYLDNSLYELRSAWDPSEYAKVIDDLKPTYYVTPDIFNTYQENIDSQLNFIEKYGKSFEFSKPLVVCHGKNIFELLKAFELFNEKLDNDAMIAIPFGSATFINETENMGYLNKKDIDYEPLRMALNRKLFLNLIAPIANKSKRKIHLLGCKSLEEFSPWESKFDKSFIYSLDTSHPVALSLECVCSYYDQGYFTRENGSKIPLSLYKPEFLIDKHFDIDYNNIDNKSDIERNIKYFQDKVKDWWSK